jgi:hypothetical protein
MALLYDFPKSIHLLPAKPVSGIIAPEYIEP